jgi:hypothetical protein
VRCSREAAAKICEISKQHCVYGHSYRFKWQRVTEFLRGLNASRFELTEYGDIIEGAIFVPTYQKNRKKTDRLSWNLLDFA